MIAQKGPRPSWVNEIEFKEESIQEDNEGFQYLLVDDQENMLLESRYWHVAIKITNIEGVQSMSDISVDYDPTYQKFSYHKVIVWRDGKPIDQLKRTRIQTLQRESSMDRSLYDGSISAVINLSDVRVGDIIEYDYSVQGYNPVNRGSFAQSFSLGYSSPVNLIYCRLVAPKNKALQVKDFEGAAKPQILDKESVREYIWRQEALDKTLYESTVPSWYSPYKRSAVTTFKNWGEVAEWALPMYEYPDKPVKIDKPEVTEGSLESRVMALIRTVQDDVRYLGFESGIGAYKPNPPVQVYSQRYGDCKDKSLLLVSLLRDAGLEAYPLLVNTELREKLVDRLPRHNAFDHCVVQFNMEGKDYYVDPTISNQGGDLEHMSFPDYGKGLLIKPGVKDLITLPGAPRYSTFIKELIEMDSVGGSASLTIRTEYEGMRADNIRSQFAASTRESIQRDYQDYYRNVYSSIVVAKDLKFLDYQRSGSNQVVVEEYYTIPDFWLQGDEYLYCETYPLVLEGKIGYAKSSNYDVPYYVGRPENFEQMTQLEMPRNWPVEPYFIEIKGEGFSYENSIESTGSTVFVSHKYEVTSASIPGSQLEAFFKKHEDIQAELSYYLIDDGGIGSLDLSSGTGGVIISIAILLVTIMVSVIMAVVVYRSYDPAPVPYAQNLSIGGWLVLPAIGIILSPILLIFGTLNAGFFDAEAWSAIMSMEEQRGVMILMFSLEIAANGFLLVLSALVIILFFERRTSLPRVITLFYVFNLAIPILDHILVEALMPDLLGPEDVDETIREAFRGTVAAAIWIPYFNIADRVKSTFCKQRKPVALDELKTTYDYDVPDLPGER
ncbi:MAG: hypothetical protein Roseis2KO_27920 [Roseivirga sp.]